MQKDKSSKNILPNGGTKIITKKTNNYKVWGGRMALQGVELPLDSHHILMDLCWPETPKFRVVFRGRKTSLNKKTCSFFFGRKKKTKNSCVEQHPKKNKENYIYIYILMLVFESFRKEPLKKESMAMCCWRKDIATSTVCMMHFALKK